MSTLYRPATTTRDDGLTERQHELFAFIYGHARDHGYQPSLRELMGRFGIRSPNGVHAHLRSLARKGWVEPADGHGRAVRLLRRPDGSPFTGFADKPAAGSIDDLVDRWHAGAGGGVSLREFLGMTPAAYDEWARTGKPPGRP